MNRGNAVGGRVRVKQWTAIVHGWYSEQDHYVKHEVWSGIPLFRVFTDVWTPGQITDPIKNGLIDLVLRASRAP